MRTVIFLAAMTIGLTANTQIKLPKVDKDSVDAITMYTCGCFVSTEDYDNAKDTVYYLTFDADNYGILTPKQMEKVYGKLMEVLALNGRDVKDTDRAMVADTVNYPDLKQIQKKLSIGYYPEERFDYVIKDHVVSLIYSHQQYQLMIYRNPYAD
jgi:hypothetical protein